MKQTEPKDSIDITYTDNESESDGDTSYETDSGWKNSLNSFCNNLIILLHWSSITKLNKQ